MLTLDTGRLHEETHDYIEYVREQFPIRLRILAPDADELEAMTGEHGDMLFRQSVPLRNQCCAVRKVNPLARALREYDAWITGLRRDQTPTRAATPVVASDPGHEGMTKVVPLATWSRDQVWDYLRDHGIRHHPLYDRGYMSIGCAPCTRATQPGEQERAGRWWWESDTAQGVPAPSADRDAGCSGAGGVPASGVRCECDPVLPGRPRPPRAALRRARRHRARRGEGRRAPSDRRDGRPPAPAVPAG